MPLNANLTPDQKAYFFDFWADVFKQIGFEPVFTKAPASLILLSQDSVDLQQVTDLRALARKLATYADKLEAEVRKAMPVEAANQNGDEGEDADMLPPAIAPIAPRRKATRDGR